jgi:phosphoglycerate dehydrogenase-like enzyme
MVEKERRAQVAQADYFMLYTVGFEDIDIAKKAKLMQILSAGYDRLNVPELAEAGIPLATNGGANAPTVAEHTLLLILSLYRKLPLHHAALKSGKWLGHQEVLGLNELRGKQVGIVGFGKIGQEVARMVNGFLANVVYYDVFKAPDEVEQNLSARRLELDALLRTSDIVTIHTPLTESSRGLINAKSLQLMKRNAILINTARGAAVVEKDLIDALEKGIIAGAGLDVYEKEPLGDSPLLSFENVVLTPHTAGSTIDTWWRRLDFAFENIQRVSRGEDPTFIVEV